MFLCNQFSFTCACAVTKTFCDSGAVLYAEPDFLKLSGFSWLTGQKVRGLISTECYDVFEPVTRHWTAPVELPGGKLCVSWDVAGKERSVDFPWFNKKVKRRDFKDINKIHYITSLLSVTKDSWTLRHTPHLTEAMTSSSQDVQTGNVTAALSWKCCDRWMHFRASSQMDFPFDVLQEKQRREREREAVSSQVAPGELHL